MKAKQLPSGVSPLEIIAFLEHLYGKIQSIGNFKHNIKNLCPIDSSESDTFSLTFIRTKDAVQVLKAMQDSKAGVFLVNKSAPHFQPIDDKVVLRVPDPQLAFVELQEKFFIDFENQHFAPSIHPTSVIDPSARVGENVFVGPYVVIGANSIIGDNSVIHAHVVIYHDVTIGAEAIIHSNSVIREHSKLGMRVVVQPGAVIGADGFGYTIDPKRGLRQVPQIGEVSIQDGVEIGANTCIDRATFGKTAVNAGTKIDNLVQVGHNVEIGGNSLICGQVGIGGSSKIADEVVLGGQVGVADHQVVAKGVRVGGGGVVISNLLKSGDYLGYPAQPAFFWRRIIAAQYSLPDMLKVFRRGSGKEEK